MLYGLKLILNSDQDLAFSRQKQILTGLLVQGSHSKNPKVSYEIMAIFDQKLWKVMLF